MKNKKPLIILGIMAALFIAVIVTFIVWLFVYKKDDVKNSTPNDIVTSFFTALAEQNENHFFATLYPATTDMYNISYGGDADFYKEIATEFYKKLEYVTGIEGLDNCNIYSVSITDTQNVSPQELKTLNTYYQQADRYKKITSASDISGLVTIIVDGHRHSVSFNIQICQCKETYYILDIHNIGN